MEKHKTLLILVKNPSQTERLLQRYDHNINTNPQKICADSVDKNKVAHNLV